MIKKKIVSAWDSNQFAQEKKKYQCFVVPIVLPLDHDVRLVE